jgi:anti-sigma regulatory factor (Ser/Thr protein kinase)
MLAPGESQSESYPAVADSVARARATVTAFAEEAGARGERLETIRLAASEAVTNAVKHAYGGRGGTINLCASYVQDELWLLIADSGSGLRAHGKRPGLGLGLMLIAQLADDFQIHSRAAGGTELQMRFRLRSPKPRPTPVRQLRGSFSSAVSPA